MQKTKWRLRQPRHDASGGVDQRASDGTMACCNVHRHEADLARGNARYLRSPGALTRTRPKSLRYETRPYAVFGCRFSPNLPFESAGFCIEWGYNHFLSVRIRVEKSPLSESAMAFVAVMTSDPPISTTLLAPALRAASLPPADFAKAGPNTVIQYIRRAFSQSMV